MRGNIFDVDNASAYKLSEFGIVGAIPPYPVFSDDPTRLGTLCDNEMKGDEGCNHIAHHLQA
jgi:hypothetical protein